MKEKLVELLEEIPHPQRLYPDLYVDRIIAKGVTVQEWISVKDRLPDKDKYVWCYSNKNGGDMFVGYRGYISGDWMEGGSLHIGDVTHWMPLPQPPTL